MFSTELSGLKLKYENSILLVSEASKNLSILFKGKMVKMKNRVAKFFAEIESS